MGHKGIIALLFSSLMLLVFSTGCSKSAETGIELVADTLPQASAAPRYTMVLAMPTDVEEVFSPSDEARQLYAQPGGALTITTEVLQAESLDILLSELTGLERSCLTMITTWQEGLPKHDLTWTAAGESGMNVYRSAILDDGTYYYIATAAVPEEQAAEYANEMRVCLSGAFLAATGTSSLTVP